MSFRMFLTILACLLSWVSCSDDADEFRIISGRTASSLEFPYMAEIQKRRIHWCGGSIISEYFVLTAAHCMCSANRILSPRIYKVIVGNEERMKGGTEYRIQEFVVHENYNNQAVMDEHDIGLIKLIQPITFNPRVQPVLLASVTPEPGETGWVVGFGRTRPVRSVNEGHLMAVELPVVSLEKCKKIIPMVANDMICAGQAKGTGDACQGDSGGPYVIGEHQVGVVAWGIGCGRQGLPGVYTNVAYYKEWIDSKLEAAKNKTI